MSNIELERFIDQMIELAGEKGYRPTEFIKMRDRYQTVEAISRLVVSGDIQSGFRRLNELELRDWTIEAAVLKYSNEFTPAVFECAKFRLSLI